MHTLRVPILVVHGSLDRQIPVRHAQRLAEAGRETRLEILEGADDWAVPKHPRFEPVVADVLEHVFRRHGVRRVIRDCPSDATFHPSPAVDAGTGAREERIGAATT